MYPFCVALVQKGNDGQKTLVPAILIATTLSLFSISILSGAVPRELVMALLVERNEIHTAVLTYLR
jgi:hypothetical protein